VRLENKLCGGRMVFGREELELDKANSDIEQARARIRRQEDLIEELKRDGHDITLSTELLHSMHDLLEAMIDHRDTIKRMIESIRHGRL
jgi:ppGpp synthetase/RelA/SpoT-type nucleotidyltranferase